MHLQTFMHKIYIVAGTGRSGTSLMMHILKNIGIEPAYVKQQYKQNFQDYYYEHPKYFSGGVKPEHVGELKGKCVKLRYVLENDVWKMNNTKVIIMKRNKDNVKRSFMRILQKNRKKHKDVLFDVIDKFDPEEICNRVGGIVVDFDSLIDKPQTELIRISRYLDKKIDIVKTSKLIDKNMRHYK